MRFESFINSSMANRQVLSRELSKKTFSKTIQQNNFHSKENLNMRDTVISFEKGHNNNYDKKPNTEHRET